MFILGYNFLVFFFISLIVRVGFGYFDVEFNFVCVVVDEDLFYIVGCFFVLNFILWLI